MNSSVKFWSAALIGTCSIDIALRIACIISTYKQKHGKPEIPNIGNDEDDWLSELDDNMNKIYNQEDDEWDIK